MDGLKNSREAMAILNEPSDILTITTLKWGSGMMDNKKQCNASTQTDCGIMREREGLLRYSAPPSKLDPPPVYSCVPPVTKWSRRAAGNNNKCNRNSSPVTFEQERDDAIAELDSVIESYHSRSQRRTKHLEKNNGTWPKARYVMKL